MRKYTWSPDLPDHRDHLYRDKFGASVITQSSDLTAKFPPAFDQGDLGSCTGNGLAGQLAFIHGALTPEEQFARLFIYRGERVIEKTVRQDAGAQIRDGIKFLAKAGCCLETEWPYDITQFKKKPPAKCFADALQYKISDYTRLESLDDMLMCLSSGMPFVFGFSVYESFESEEVAKTGIVPMPGKNERQLGGHCVEGEGHDMKRRMIKCRNSWGTGWGQQGSFWIPFDYIGNRNLADDAWVIRK